MNSLIFELEILQNPRNNICPRSAEYPQYLHYLPHSEKEAMKFLIFN